MTRVSRCSTLPLDISVLSCSCLGPLRNLPSFPTRRSSDLVLVGGTDQATAILKDAGGNILTGRTVRMLPRSEEHTSELQSLRHLVCLLALEKKNTAKSERAGPSDRPTGQHVDEVGRRPLLT